MSGPTQGAERHTENVNRWTSHPHLARLLRALVLSAPVVVAIALTYGAGRLLPPERLGVSRWTWIFGAFVVCNVALIWVGKFTRRVTPLIALMKLSLVFPDQAPSRAKVTLRKSSSRKMLRELELARARGETSGAVTHGEYMVQLLREINEHDRLTRGHSERVRAYAEMLGEEIGLGKNDMDKLRWAALLHDAGKLEVPEHILNKDGRPDEAEWALLQKHPAEGGRLLAPLQPWLGDWVHAADQHHLRWDGKGYPLDLGGTQISLSGRLVAIADAYDVMSSARSYKAPLTPEVARQELTTCAGSQFDPALVRAFLNIGLGRLRAVAGRLAWMSNLVGSTRVSSPIATSAVVSVGTGAAAAAAVVLSLLVGAIDGDDQPDQAQPVVEETASGVRVEDLDLSATEDEPMTIELTAEGVGTISFEVGGAAHGQVVMGRVESAGTADMRDERRTTVTYHPAADYGGDDSFGFEACDATGSCDVGTVTLHIAAANDSPSAMEDYGSTETDQTLEIDVVANDTDIDGDQLRLVEVYRPSRGEARIVDGKIVFDPPPGFDGTVRIRYVVADPSGARAIGTLIVEVRAGGRATPVPPTTTTTRTSAAIADHPPVAGDDSATVSEDSSSWIAVLDNDHDPEGVPLTISGVGAPIHGTAVSVLGHIVYTPASDYWGTDVFSYTISDGTNADVSAAVTVSVIAVNDPPTARASDAAVAENSAVGTVALRVSATDVDGDTLAYAIISGDPTGRFTIDGAGVLTTAATIDHEVTPSYTLGLAVGDGTVLVPLSATVTITDVDEAPTAGDDTASTTEDTPVAIAVATNDSDPEGAALTFAVPATSSSGGTLAEVAGIVAYTPPADFNGTDSFTYTTADPGGNLSAPATVTITVTAVDDAPVAVDDGGVGFTTLEDALFTTGDVTVNDSDAEDGTIDPATVNVVTLPADGTLVDNGDGTFDYDPDPDFNGTDSFTYEVSDVGLLVSNTATVTITVTAVNDAPVAVDDGGVGFTTLEDALFTTGDVTVNDSDAEDGTIDPATVNVVTLPADGTLVDNGDGTFDYDPDPDFNGTDSFTYEVSDVGLLVSNTATVTITVTAVNDAPVAVDDGGVGFTTLEDALFTTGDVTVNDSDAEDGTIDPATVNVVTLPADGTLVDNGDGTFDYDPDPDFNGTDSFTYEVSDVGLLVSNTATVTITVTAVNDAPVAVDDGGVGFTTLEDTLLTTRDVTANDSDVDDPVDPASITIVTPPATGTLVDNGDGTFDFDPAPAWSGTETFTYTVADPGALPSNVATVTLDVASTNTPPVAGDDGGIGFTTLEDTLLTTGDVTANDSDPQDGTIDPANITILTLPANGTLVHNGDGTFDYDPDSNFSGTDTFTYEVNDTGLLLSNTATVTLTITAVNDAPVAGDDGGVGFTTLEDSLFTTGDVTVSDSDVEDGTIDPATINVLSLPANGALVDNGDGTFDYDPDPDFNGTDTFTYEVSDTGLLLSNTATVTLTITAVNDAPSFTPGANVTVTWNSGISTTPGWASAISTGPPDESGQTPAFMLTNDNTALFSSQPTISAAGTLTFTAAAGAYGTATVDVTLMDDGGIGNGGNDTSPTFQFTIAVDVEDFDGVPTGVDNCPTVFNPGQFDTDGDGVGDACDSTPTAPSTGTFITTGQPIGNGTTFGIALGDLDGDGDLDAAFAMKSAPNTVWLNDGTGTFTDTGQTLASSDTVAVALADLDGDGDLDLAFAHNAGKPNTVFLNDGTGSFTDTGQALGGVADSEDLGVGDLDGDGDLDLVFANADGPNTVWLNDGTGTFINSGQALGLAKTMGVALADFDGDGDLDLAFANDGAPDTVWRNDGTGTFTDTGQALGSSKSSAIVAGDVDGDGDIDFVSAADNDVSTVWRNDGTGTFTDTGVPILKDHNVSIAIGDLDGDGDLDVVTGTHDGGDTVLHLNNGAGVFTASGQALGSSAAQGLALGDLDGDGDLDAFVGDDGGPDAVFVNQ